MVEFLKSVNDKKSEILPSHSILNKSKRIQNWEKLENLENTAVEFYIVYDLLQTLKVPIYVLQTSSIVGHM